MEKTITLKYGKRSTSFVLKGKVVMSFDNECSAQDFENELRHWRTSGYTIVEKGL